MAHIRDRRHLWTAVEARNRIGQAQGILMQRYSIDPDTAYAYLRRLSQHGNIRLRDIAAQIIADAQPGAVSEPADGPHCTTAAAPPNGTEPTETADGMRDPS